MDTLELFQRIGIAIAIGLLIGIERGWRERDAADGSRVAGIRTYALIGLLGGIWAALVPVVGAWPLALAGFALAGALILFYSREVAARGEFSVTGVIAGLVTFALGVFAVLGEKSVAIAAGVVAILLLTAREYLHDFLKRVTWPELRSAVILLAMTFLALPLLPDRAIDPWDAINPHDIWLMTVLIAAISYAGYIAVRVGSNQTALIYGSVAGALVSSTTVTLINARLARKANHHGASAAAVSIAWIVSLLRMTAVAVSLNWALLAGLAAPIAAAVAVLAVASLILYRRGDGDKAAKPEFDNPFDLLPVLGFGALLAVIMLATKLAHDSFGQLGLIPLAVISGFADVDPIAISVAKMVGASLTPIQAATAVLAAGAANLTTKMVVSLAFGGVRFGLPLAIAGVCSLAAGGIVLAAQSLM